MSAVTESRVHQRFARNVRGFTKMIAKMFAGSPAPLRGFTQMVIKKTSMARQQLRFFAVAMIYIIREEIMYEKSNMRITLRAISFVLFGWHGMCSENKSAHGKTAFVEINP